MGEARKWKRKAKKLSKEVYGEAKDAVETGIDLTKAMTIDLAKGVTNSIEGLSAKESGDTADVVEVEDKSGSLAAKVKENARKQAAAYKEGMNGRSDTFLGGSVGDDETLKKKKLLGS